MSKEQNKYKIILDNLLDISQTDSSIFTKIQNKYFYDLYSLIGDKNWDTFYNNETFQISALDNNVITLIEKISNISGPDNLVLYLESKLDVLHHLKIKVNLENVQQDWEYYKKKILNDLQLMLQKSITQWKLLDDKVTNILDETNIWPLYIGFLFISLKKDDKFIYAPLFLKQASIDFVNGKPIIKSDGDIKVNEKLVFFLNNNDFKISIDAEFKDYKISTLINKLQEDWNDLFDLPVSLKNPFEKISNPEEEITNENIKFHPGAVLGIYQPWGGYARNRMKEIAQKDEIDNIIKVEFNKNIYKATVEHNTYRDNTGLIKITDSNLSQDKAIVSSMLQNTVIWGPPGTGKSQTIVNILANILVRKKTAIVASQKRAALEVIKNRLDDLSAFCLFILNTKNTNRKSFYEPIKKYLDMLENFSGTNGFHPLNVISESEINFIDAASEYLNDSLAKDVLLTYYYFASQKQDFDHLTDIEFLLSLPKDVKYPTEPTNQQTAKELLKLSKYKYLPFVKEYRRLKELGNLIDEKLPAFNGSLNDLMKFVNTIGFEHINSEHSPFKKLNNLITAYKNIQPRPQRMSIEEVRDFVAHLIVARINKFDEKLKKEYREFAQSVRIQNLEPYRFVKKFTGMIKQLFPIVVATPNADLSGWSKEEFDYAILDESSQIFIENAIPILYLAKFKIFAGDTEQMKPTSWFVQRITDDSIFGKVESVLDYALSLGVHNVMLDKNYRSNHAELMGFSSKTFYQSKLNVLDAANAWNNEPIEVYQVDGSWDQNKNIVEAKLAIDKVIENIDKYKKIILLSFNVKQSNYITELIYNQYPLLEKAIHSKRLLIRNIENIQGDEADLVIATIAYDKNTKLSSTYVSRPGGKNALNVAISRAKEKMIIIKTIKSEDIILTPEISDDIRVFKSWLQFLEKESEQRRIEIKESFDQNHYSISNTKLKDDWFKNLVFNRIKSAIAYDPNFEVFKDYIVGSLDIDIVVTYNKIPFKCISFDTMYYANSKENFVSLYDAVKFLKSKSYDVEVVTPINWIWIQNQIDSWFTPEKTKEFKSTSKGQVTNTYTINKTAEHEVAKEPQVQNQILTAQITIEPIDEEVDEVDLNINDEQIIEAEEQPAEQVVIHSEEKAEPITETVVEEQIFDFDSSNEDDDEEEEVMKSKTSESIEEQNEPEEVEDTLEEEIDSEDELVDESNSENDNKIETQNESDVYEEIWTFEDNEVSNDNIETEQIIEDIQNEEVNEEPVAVEETVIKEEQPTEEAFINQSEIDSSFDDIFQIKPENIEEQITQEFVADSTKEQQTSTDSQESQVDDLDYSDEDDDNFVLNFESFNPRAVTKEEQITLDKVEQAEEVLNKKKSHIIHPTMQDKTEEWIYDGQYDDF
ncbi:AAA domain-containing protein [Mycoplasma sp. 1199]|uniref:AAA domain-containing protein n=1 Tax=Mycoplasma sp. 1199 TaxID=3108526 RepID=UPI002B1D085D|nr:AAA domain-containing protein [Mycoplasma sp. 1199]MEA4206134.1 AAA domain-containing protein [Mycoplasma sp. 1199]